MSSVFVFMLKCEEYDKMDVLNVDFFINVEY